MWHIVFRAACWLIGVFKPESMTKGMMVRKLPSRACCMVAATEETIRPIPTAADEEKKGPQIEGGQRPLERYFKPEKGQRQNHCHLHQADENAWDGFTDHDLDGPERSYQQLVECPLFPFARHGHGGYDDHLNQSLSSRSYLGP